MIRREGKGHQSTDLLVCFPTRAHLTLMPKPICSPRHSENKKIQHHRRKSFNRGGAGGGGHASPHLWSKTKQMGSELSEPTSPKVTCAGQIKVRPRTGPCKTANWQSVMEEIERLHNNRNQKKKPTWVEGLGFKKDVMQFLTCLKNLKFDFRCFGAFPNTDITSNDDDEDDDDDDDEDDTDHHHDHDHDHQGNDDHEHGHDQEEDEASSKTAFSKWFMVLQENQDCGVLEKEEKDLNLKEKIEKEKPMNNDDAPPPCMPPSNALLLMRCRSAPAKSWLEEKQEEEDDDDDVDDDHGDGHDDDDEKMKKEEKEKKRESLMDLMKYETDFYKLSCDIAKETWVISGINQDPFSRSRSWKR